MLDTSTAAGAQALVVLAAARAAEDGGSLDQVEAAAKKAIDAVRLVAMVSDLDHLVRSGRVPEIAGWAGRRLGIRPLFEFRDGLIYWVDNDTGLHVAKYTGPRSDELPGPGSGVYEGNATSPHR